MILASTKYDFLKLSAVLLVSFILVYYVPITINKILFLFFLPIIWYSRKDYFWFTYLLILLDQPGGFFSGGTRNDIYRLPIYTITSGISITYTELIIIIFFIKTIIKKKRVLLHIYFSKELLYLTFYFFLLIIISMMLGTSLDNISKIIIIGINLTLFYSLFNIFSDFDKLLSFFKLLFPFAFVALLFQLYGVTFDQQPIELFKPGIITIYRRSEQGEWQRPLEMVFSLFIIFSGSLYLLGQKQTFFKRNYLLIINGASFLSIFLTGTRSWITAFIFSYFVFFFSMKSKHIVQFFQIIASTLAIYIIISLAPPLKEQFQNASERLSTVEYLTLGDKSLGGTARRYTVFAPNIFNYFKESTIIFGAAFSNFYYEHSNIHVGYHNMLFNVGIFGVLLYIILLFKIISKALSRSSEMKLALIPLFILLIINTAVESIGFGVIHTTFFIIQAYTFALIALSYNIHQNNSPYYESKIKSYSKS